MTRSILLCGFFILSACEVSRAPSTCGEGLTTCGSTCVNAQTDPANCGVCGRVCATQDFCEDAVCVPPATSCDDGLELCSGRCYDTQTNRDHCGSCDHACDSGENCVAASCESTTVDPQAPVFLSFGTNVSQLSAGQSVTFSAVLTDPDGIDDLIGGTLMSADESITYGAFTTSGQEGSYTLTLTWDQIDATDPLSFVGETNRVFAARFFDAAGHATTRTKSIRFFCTTGTGACNGVCYDLQSDETHCGNCQTTCSGAYQECVTGQCKCVGETDSDHCYADYHDCNMDTWTDRCGVSRPGACGCGSSGSCCNYQCVDVTSNENNCGRCGVVIPTGGSCNNGVPSCGSQTLCGSECFPIEYTEAHCGRCDRACEEYASCNNSGCEKSVVDDTFEAGMTCNAVCTAAGYSECLGVYVTYTDGYYTCGGPEITCSDEVSQNSACNSIWVYFRSVSCDCRAP